MQTVCDPHPQNCLHALACDLSFENHKEHRTHTKIPYSTSWVVKNGGKWIDISLETPKHVISTAENLQMAWKNLLAKSCKILAAGGMIEARFLVSVACRVLHLLPWTARGGDTTWNKQQYKQVLHSCRLQKLDFLSTKSGLLLDTNFNFALYFILKKPQLPMTRCRVALLSRSRQDRARGCKSWLQSWKVLNHTFQAST